jgi:putative transposase
MSRTGTPDDNAQAESVIKTLKYEAVHFFEGHNLAEARGRIGQCIAAVSNDKRRPSALGSRPPAAFERLLIPAFRASLAVSPQGFTPA